MKTSALTCLLLIPFLLLIILSTNWVLHGAVLGGSSGGEWKLLQDSIGITAMHMQLLNNDRVVIFDRTDFGRSNLSLPDGKCRNDSDELVLRTDCTAHSVEYDVVANTFRPLMVQTDVWCSSGAATEDGRLVQTGGFNDGDHKVRIFSPCNNGSCDWVEIGEGLKNRRWYSTNHILPDGRQIIVGGRAQFNYEFYPKDVASSGVVNLPFLGQTNDRGSENNLYPFVFLNVDGTLFVFANNRSILLDYKLNKVVRSYPTIPGGDPRSYPSTGSATLLPVRLRTNSTVEAEVLVCGGAPRGSFTKAGKGIFVRALDTCGRIKITDPNPHWEMETMPLARVMGDITLLPNGNVLIINGAGSGTAGWEYGREPVLNPVLYRTNNDHGSRFETQNATTIPRMYHSTAILVRDGRVLVGGSNPHEGYSFKGILFPTELSLEAFHPSYLDSQFDHLRPKILSPNSTAQVGYGQDLAIRFNVTGELDQSLVGVTMVAPSFTTHSFAMNHRLLVLGNQNLTVVGPSTYEVRVSAPGSATLAPSGFYMLFVVHREIPSLGTWIQIK